MDYIQGQKFKTLSKFIYVPQRGVEPKNPDWVYVNTIRPTDYRYLVNTLDLRSLEDGDIIYTHTFYANQLFDHLQNTNKKVIVITHNADTNIDFEPPENVLMWYTTNVNIKHERIRSIPIGIENDIWLKDKARRLELKIHSPKLFRRMIYLNHNISTNPAKRQRPYDVLAGKPWVTTAHGVNGQGFDSYIDNVYNHPFVVCPEGNGIDTHRVWECLYVNTIPVQIRNINNQFYSDVPILFIDDWEELTEKFLHDAYMRITNAEWNKDKIWFAWWKNEILRYVALNLYS